MSVLEGDAGEINCLTVLENDFIVSGTNRGTLQIWNPFNKTLIRTINYPDEQNLPINNLLTLPNGNLITSTRNKIRIWIPSTTKWTDTIQTLSTDQYSAKISYLSNGYLVSIRDFLTITIWNPDTGEIYQELMKQKSNICNLIVMNNNTLVSASIDFIVTIWNITDGTVNQILKLPLIKSPILLASLPSNDLIIATNQYLSIWNISTGLMKKEFTINSIDNITVFNNGFVALSFIDHIRIYDPNSGELIRELNVPDDFEIKSLNVLKNGNLIAGSNFGKILIWNTKFLS